MDIAAAGSARGKYDGWPDTNLRTLDTIARR